MIEYFKKIKRNRGMTYVELVVVLLIFAMMSSIMLFNYKTFQGRIDIKNLANDIALKIVQAQKDSLAGKLPTQTPGVSPWKPSYGFWVSRLVDTKSFIYFTDLNQDGNLDNSACPPVSECVDKISITKGNTISSLVAYYQGGTSATLNDLIITFKRPDSSAIIKSAQIPIPPPFPISYVQISVSSPSSIISNIKIYPSGRIQIN